MPPWKKWQFHRAEWRRGDVIRRLTSGLGFFGLWRSAPGHGKTSEWQLRWACGLFCKRLKLNANWYQWRLRQGVFAAFAPRVASHYSPGRQGSALQRPIFPHGLQPVVAACGLELADGWIDGTQRHLVQADAGPQRPGGWLERHWEQALQYQIAAEAVAWVVADPRKNSHFTRLPC